MRYAIIADVHANLEALGAVLEAIDGEGIARIFCLGDLVGYHANPNECVALIQARGIPCIRGNHDAVAARLAAPVDFGQTAKQAILWTQAHLVGECRRFLETLPLVQVVDGQFVAVHGSLHPRPNDLLRIRSEIEAEESLEALKRNFPGLRLCFFGHMHRPVAYEMSDGEVCEMPGKELELKPQAYYLINPGSVGQSRDEDPRAAYGVFDSERHSVRFRRVEYDRTSADRKVGEAGLAVEPGVMRRSASWIKRGLARTVRRASLKIGR